MLSERHFSPVCYDQGVIDPYARMSDNAPPPEGTTIYVHEKPHRIVEGASSWALSDNGESERAKDRYFHDTVRHSSKGARSHADLKEEVLIAARRSLYATGGGQIITVGSAGEIIDIEQVERCAHLALLDDFMGGDICKECGKHF